MIYRHQSYRTYLRDTLAERVSSNARYSLRAFARNLGISPSILSHVLRGEKSFSPSLALSVATSLNLTGQEREYFCLLVQYESARTPELKSDLLSKLKLLNRNTVIQDLQLDVFKMISDWYHIPILEMARMVPVDLSPENIAKSLGIAKIEAEAAIERLVRLDLLVPGSVGKLERKIDDCVVRSEIPSSALRKFHKQMLEKAISAIETQTPQEKSIGSETFAIDTKHLPAANALIEEFFGKMVSFFSSGERKTAVYHLGLQLFRLTEE